MANWSGSAMISAADAIFGTILDMKAANEDFLAATKAYSNVIHDEISVQSEELVTKMNILLEEIDAYIHERAEHLKEAGSHLIRTEDAFAERIRMLKK